MIFAVSMTFIDQTTVAIAIPTIQDDLSLSATGVQWIVNGYQLALSALFAFGGRLARTVFYAIAAVMAVAFLVALFGMPGGRVESEADPSAAASS